MYLILTLSALSLDCRFDTFIKSQRRTVHLY